MHGLQEGHRDQNRPGNLHQSKKHHTETCGAFFVKAKRVRASFPRESAVHGLQESHRDYNSPVISTRTKALHGNVWCFLFYLPFTLTSPFMKKAFVAARRP